MGGAQDPGHDGQMLYAYIDESGQRGHAQGGSRHFVMSAVMYRSASVTRATDLLAQLRTMTGRQPTHELSFKKLSDPHRATSSTVLAAATWLKIATVVVCKDHIGNTLPDDNMRYLFAFRFLLERISWLARSHDEVADYTLAHIQRFRLENLREYETALRALETEIKWSHLNPAGGQINQPRVLEQLQLADLVASSCGVAFSPPENTGVVETSYLRALRPRFYEPKGGRLTSYGLKMHPWNETTKAAYPWVAAL
jgi:hypothetical protein